ncbi:MAG: phosphatidate cytidylyltransferase [Candidatus Lambdaproteobacteria bacterium]|nr:phosphatidate cytidylyltransferase [Candidatus Lambdaproteobacteria bacterium]
MSDPELQAPLEQDSSRLVAFLGQKLWQRVVVGVPALIVVLILAVMAPPLLLGVVVAAVGSYGMFEFLRLTGVAQTQTATRRLLIAAGALPALGAVTAGSIGLALGLLLGVAAIVALLLFAGDRETALHTTGLSTFGLVLVSWSLAHLLLLAGLPQGRGLLVMLVLCLSLSDTLAYTVGSLVGRHLLCPSISPRKTVEGALAGLGGGVMGGLVGSLWLLGGPLGLGVLSLALLGALLSLLGQLGDLLESRIKRLCNANDSGAILPGHGGLLDRIDAFLLSTPLLYYIAVSSLG